MGKMNLENVIAEVIAYVREHKEDLVEEYPELSDVDVEHFVKTLDDEEVLRLYLQIL
jgi:hypothetical protein